MTKPAPEVAIPLYSWLRANALFSALGGAVIAVLSSTLPGLLGVGNRLLYVVVGVALVLYGGRLRVLSRRKVARLEARAIVAGDVLWVVGSAVVLFRGVLTPAGVWIVGLVAAVVLVFAIGQGVALTRPSPRVGAACTSLPLTMLTLTLLAAPHLGSPATLAAQMSERTEGRTPGLPRAELPPPEALRVLTPTSSPAVDRMLEELEEAYASMDIDRFVSFYTDDFEQVDVNRRIHIQGRDAWRAQTERINRLHERMGRRHHGRAQVDNWIVVELEWFGTVRGEAVGRPGEMIAYRYDGIGLLQVDDGHIRRQILWGDVVTLDAQLEGLEKPLLPPPGG